MNAKTLVLGWGNPGRGDDGLGPELVRALTALQLPEVDMDSDYQLQVEDAFELVGYQRVLFVDADREAAEPFWLRRLYPNGSISFSTHSLSPGAVLAMARDLFGAEPEAWIMGIRGYEFDEFGERLSDRAKGNLDRAVQSVRSALEDGTLEEVASEATEAFNDQDRLGETCQTTSP